MPLDPPYVATFEPEPMCVICEQPESNRHPVAVCDGCLTAAREQWEALSPDERARLIEYAEEVCA